MDGNKGKIASFLMLLITNPILAVVVVLALFGILIMVLLFLAFSLLAHNEAENNNGGGDGFQHYACTQGDLNEVAFSSQFDNAGAFTGMENVFVSVAERNGIDPVLLAAIAFHETGRGSSNAVKNKNNPGGLMNPATNWSTLIEFSSLEEGLNAMAKNLYKNYIGMGLLTPSQISSKYAPIGAANDPNNLNSNWLGTVTIFINGFGGLTQNCSETGFAGGTSSPIDGPITITSKFGTRVHPITGIVHGHRGTDMACSTGTPIKSILDGKVAVAKGHPTWGNYVVVSHGDKHSLYAHLSQIYATVGDVIPQGTVIGACGQTGSATGPHLHLEIHLGKVYGTLVDPLPYLNLGK